MPPSKYATGSVQTCMDMARYNRWVHFMLGIESYSYNNHLNIFIPRILSDARVRTNQFRPFIDLNIHILVTRERTYVGNACSYTRFE